MWGNHVRGVPQHMWVTIVHISDASHLLMSVYMVQMSNNPMI